MTFARRSVAGLLACLIATPPIGAAAEQPTSAAQYKTVPPALTPGRTSTGNGTGGKDDRVPSPPRRPMVATTAVEPKDPGLSDQCAWLGKRIISLLVRDDAMTATDFGPFYQRFNCSEERLSKAFGCLVANLDTVENSVFADQVEECWRDPQVRYAPAAETSPIEPSRPKTEKPPG